ncbi:hypothetical protein [Aquimarina sp. 2304DJ70-9]|uniref:hypothetical protein n=1 Tax=Aquimarina penaris TaxID=3231044 RepID=UPI0034635AEA
MLSRKITFIFFLNLTIFSFAQCKTVGDTTTEKTSLPTAIKPVVNTNATTRLNGDKSMELHIQKNMKVGDPASHYKYIVYKAGTKEIVKKGTFRGAGVDWNNNTSLKLTPYIGMEQKPVSDNPEDILNKNTHTQLIIINLNN